MEVAFQQVHQIVRKSEASTQITFDEDYNVPDVKPDVGRIVQKAGEIVLDEAQVSENRIRLTGKMRFHLLYVGEGEERHVCSLDGELPLDESMNLEGLSSGDKVRVIWNMEDLNIHLINSRKLNVRSVVSFTASVDEERSIRVPLGVNDCEGISVQNHMIDVLELGVHKKDTLRIKKELTLPSNKPSIHTILWKDVQMRGTDIRCEDNIVMTKGELFVFILYSGDDEDHPLQYMEQAVPWEQRVACTGCAADMIPNIHMVMTQSNLEAAPDPDGEERMLALDVVLELDIKSYREEKLSMLDDIYHPGLQLKPVTESDSLYALLVKNNAKCRITDKAAVPYGGTKVLQICHSEAKAKIEHCKIGKDRIQVEGILELRILYIISDDEMPYYSMETVIPYTHTIETPGITEACIYDLHSDIEQLSTTMLDSSDIEVKALLTIDTLVLKPQNLSLIHTIESAPQPRESLETLPGIVCYYTQEGDTLWTIAKTFHTTIPDIQTLNPSQPDPLPPGTPLLLVKKIE